MNTILPAAPQEQLVIWMSMDLFLTAKEIDLEKLCVVTGRRQQGANSMVDLSLYPEHRHPSS